jgi:hypothetical protein
MNSQKITLISNQSTICRNKERDFTNWNFALHAVHALNPKDLAKAKPSFYAVQNATIQRSL